MVGIPSHPICHPDYVKITNICTTEPCMPGKSNYRKYLVVDISGEVCVNKKPCDCPPVA